MSGLHLIAAIIHRCTHGDSATSPDKLFILSSPGTNRNVLDAVTREMTPHYICLVFQIIIECKPRVCGIQRNTFQVVLKARWKLTYMMRSVIIINISSLYFLSTPSKLFFHLLILLLFLIFLLKTDQAGQQ